MLNTMTLGVVALGCLLRPADGTGPTPAKIEFAYTEPSLSADGSLVGWHWTLTNTGGQSAGQVLFTQRLKPMLKLVDVSKECAVNETAIRCEYGTVAAGARLTGTLVARIPADQTAGVTLSGQVSWAG